MNRVCRIERSTLVIRLRGQSMSYIGTNLVAIFLATVGGMAISAAGVGFMRRFEPPSPVRTSSWFIRPLIVGLLAEFWLAAILAGALILAPPQGDPWTMAIGSAIVIWIGFVLPVLVATYTFRAVPVATTAIDCFHWLAVMVCQAAILHLIGLVRPH